MCKRGELEKERNDKYIIMFVIKSKIDNKEYLFKYESHRRIKPLKALLTARQWIIRNKAHPLLDVPMDLSEVVVSI